MGWVRRDDCGVHGLEAWVLGAGAGLMMSNKRAWHVYGAWRGGRRARGSECTLVRRGGEAPPLAPQRGLLEGRRRAAGPPGREAGCTKQLAPRRSPPSLCSRWT